MIGSALVNRVFAAASIVASVAVACGGESKHRASATAEPDAGSDPIVCDATSADCNGEPADGCEVELATNGEHCGACGIDCMLGPCIDGRCGAPPEPIGAHGAVCEMVTDGDTVYWADCEIGASHEVVAFPADGTSRGEVVATVTDGMGWFYALAVDDEALYWTVPGTSLAGVGGSTSGGIGRFDKISGTSELIIIEGDVWGVALDDERIYWSRHALASDGSETGAILARTKAGDAMDRLAETPARALVVDEAAIYFDDSANDSISRLEKGGGEPVPIGSVNGLVSGLAVAGGYVYWSDYAGLFRVPAHGGPTEVLDDVAGAFTIDADTLYYERLGTIVALRDGEITPLASLRGALGGIAVAQGHLYFADFNFGGVYRVEL